MEKQVVVLLAGGAVKSANYVRELAKLRKLNGVVTDNDMYDLYCKRFSRRDRIEV